MKQEKVVIIGNGPAGATAAIYTARAGLDPVVFAGAVPGGLLTRTSEVENFPGFPNGIQGFDLVSAMQEQAERFGARVEYEKILKAELSDGGVQKLYTESGEIIEARALIIASGAMPRTLGLEAETRLAGKGVSYCAVCDGSFFKDRAVVVAGGGDSAMEEALYLTRFASKVYLVHRRDRFRASKAMVDRVLKNPKIEVILNSTVKKIFGENHVERVRIADNATLMLRDIECYGFFAALGYIPDTELFKGQLELDEAGYIKLRDHTAETSLAGVFAAGDCADPRYRQAVTAAGMGCRAAIDAEEYLEK